MRKFVKIFLYSLFIISFGLAPVYTTFAVSTLTTNSATSITQTSAVLNGVINDVGNHSPTTRGFEWGTNTSYGTTTTDTTFFIQNTFSSIVNYATQITIDSSGNFYVTSGNQERVKKFDSSGNLLLSINTGSTTAPSGVALDSSGNIFIYDYTDSVVKKYNSSGVYQSQFGGPGSGNGQFNGENTLAIDSNDNIYVADAGNDRIQKFDSLGNYITKWGSSGSGNSQFNYPKNIIIDNNDYVYVTDDQLDRVQKFDSSGNFIMKFGSYGTNNGQFDGLTGIAFDSSGNIYATDEFNNRIQKFDSSGNYISQFGSSTVFSDPYAGLAIDSNNTIYMIDGYTDVIKLTDPNTSFSTTITELNCGTTYHYRSYITTNSGITYGLDSEFSTSQCPQVSTSASSRVSNLVSMGKIEEAKKIVQEFPNSINTVIDPEAKKLVLPTQEKEKVSFELKGSKPTERRGHKSSTVKEIQTKLKVKVDGIFGPITEKAVKDFQKLYNLKPDGIVGPRTWAELGKVV